MTLLMTLRLGYNYHKVESKYLNTPRMIDEIITFKLNITKTSQLQLLYMNI